MKNTPTIPSNNPVPRLLVKVHPGHFLELDIPMSEKAVLFLVDHVRTEAARFSKIKGIPVDVVQAGDWLSRSTQAIEVIRGECRDDTVRRELDRLRWNFTNYLNCRVEEAVPDAAALASRKVFA